MCILTEHGQLVCVFADVSVYDGLCMRVWHLTTLRQSCCHALIVDTVH